MWKSNIYVMLQHLEIMSILILQNIVLLFSHS